MLNFIGYKPSHNRINGYAILPLMPGNPFLKKYPGGRHQKHGNDKISNQQYWHNYTLLFKKASMNKSISPSKTADVLLVSVFVR